MSCPDATHPARPPEGDLVRSPRTRADRSLVAVKIDDPAVILTNAPVLILKATAYSSSRRYTVGGTAGAHRVFDVYPVDVDAVYAEVKDSIGPEWGIEEREWGTRELVLRDPNGYFVTFCQPT